MKLKIAALTAVLALTGCADMNIPIINADAVGIARTVGDRAAYDGNLQFKSGTGLVYTRSSQCGRNCGNHAALAAKLDAEKAAKEQVYQAQHEENIREYGRQARQGEIIKKCEIRTVLYTAKRKDAYEDAIRTHGFDAKVTKVYAEEYNMARNNFFKNLDRCVEVMSK